MSLKGPKHTTPSPKSEQAAEPQAPVQTAASTAMNLGGPVALEAAAPSEDFVGAFDGERSPVGLRSYDREIKLGEPDAVGVGVETQRFSFRAEAAVDLSRLLRQVLPVDPEFLLLRVNPAGHLGLDGLEVECLSSLSPEKIAAQIHGVADGHVMERTLRSSPGPEAPRPSGTPGNAPGRSPYPAEDLPGRRI